MTTTFLLEAVLGTGAGLSVLAFAVVQSLNLKLSRQLSPGDTVVHTQDASEAWWTVASVWFYGLTLIGESGQVKHMRTEDYRLLNNVSGPVLAFVEIAVPAEVFAEKPIEYFDHLARCSVIESAKSYLTEEPAEIVVVLKDLERAYTFEIRFEIENYTDKRYAEAMVRRALATKLIPFSDRAVLAANIVVER